MFIGIDVGGTFTDAVLTDGKTILGKQKVATRPDDLLTSLLNALDAVTEGLDPAQIQRVVLSTTLVTNLIAQRKYPPVALVLVPGPGLHPDEYDYDTVPWIIPGAIDYRGREIIPLNEEKVFQAGVEINGLGYNRVAVVGKFSGRDNSHELAIKAFLERTFSDLTIETGHTISGQLNFPRRIAGTMLTAAVRDLFAGFIEKVVQALAERKITAPAFILKADGGTLPLASALKMPIETIFSGPAASTLGGMSLSPPGQTSVVIDIGGTTTDLALILSGQPLLASKGARVQEYLTHVRSFAVKSIPLGGDSTVVALDGRPVILPERRGPAACLGGLEPTVTDALRFLDRIEVGDPARAARSMDRLAAETGQTALQAASLIADNACRIIVDAVGQIFQDWEQEPAYRVWEIVQETRIRPNNIVGVGGAAKGLIPAVAAQMSCRALIPVHAEVANALGAAVAQPTVAVNLRIDTEQGFYMVQEDGKTGKVSTGRMFTEEAALKLARDCLFARAEDLQIRDYVDKIEVVRSEVFNLVRDWSTNGKIYDICIQTPRDILFYLGEEGAALD